MKNMLVEATRVSNRAGNPDDVSESGSFDTTQADFASTANDPIVTGEAADTAIAPEAETLQLDEVAANWHAIEGVEASTDEVQGGQPVASEFAQPMLTHIAPVHVRFSPLICLALAVISATTWFAYLRIAASHDAAALGASLLQSRRSNPAVVTESLPESERFPYISSEAKPPVKAP